MTDDLAAIDSRSSESSFIDNQDSLHSPLGLIMTLAMVIIAIAAVGAVIFVII